MFFVALGSYWMADLSMGSPGLVRFFFLFLLCNSSPLIWISPAQAKVEIFFLNVRKAQLRPSSSGFYSLLYATPLPCSGIYITMEIKKRQGTDEDRAVHPDCRNAPNPYHECSEYCFKIIAEQKTRMNESTGLQDDDNNQQLNVVTDPNENEDVKVGSEEHSGEEAGVNENDDGAAVDFSNLTGRQKRLFELRMKMNEARKANQTAMVAEKKKMEGPGESRGVSKQKWLEERKKKIGRLLDANGLDMTKAYMLDTQEMAETKYKKWEKEPAPAGWDVFNQKTLYDAYKKRTKNVEVDLDEYNRLKEADPEFYREASSLQYGKAPNISEEKIDKMIKELKDREAKSRSFSRRRKYREEKDIDSINDRNEHFNKKIERAFGKYTLEIKNNLERGTALPD